MQNKKLDMRALLKMVTLLEGRLFFTLKFFKATKDGRRQIVLCTESSMKLFSASDIKRSA